MLASRVLFPNHNVCFHHGRSGERVPYLCSRVAEVAREHGWHPPKSLDSDENFKPEHTLFCRELRFVAIYALFFGDLWAKKVPFWVKTVLLGQEVHYYMVYIAYFTELNSKIWDYAQKRRICRKNCKYALDKRFHGHFCPRRKPAKSCHPDSHSMRWESSCRTYNTSNCLIYIYC